MLCYHTMNDTYLLPSLRKFSNLNQNYRNKCSDIENNIQPIDISNYPKTSSTNPNHIDISMLIDKLQFKIQYESNKYYNETIK